MPPAFILQQNIGVLLAHFLACTPFIFKNFFLFQRKSIRENCPQILCGSRQSRLFSWGQKKRFFRTNAVQGKPRNVIFPYKCRTKKHKILQLRGMPTSGIPLSPILFLSTKSNPQAVVFCKAKSPPPSMGGLLFHCSAA